VLGNLFTHDFLHDGIRQTGAWTALTDERFDLIKAELQQLFAAFPTTGTPNEADTEDRLVYPVTEHLGWVRTVKTAIEKANRQIPDAFLFLNPEDRKRADSEKNPVDRVKHANLLLEAKKWNVPFDRRVDRDIPPMSQLMAYLSRAEVQSNRRVRWGILTDGRKWRLSFMGASSLLTDFLEIDLAAALNVEGLDSDLFSPQSDAERDQALKIFLLFFSADAFRPDINGRTLHDIAFDEGRFWEERVRKNLSDTIFNDVFPGLIRALKTADKQAPTDIGPAYLSQLREAAFTFLYRLLFTLYAEDRDMLPKRDRDYDDYGLSKPVREHIAKRLDDGEGMSDRRPDYYDQCLKVFDMVDGGDKSIGVPPFNGGLFHADRSPLLNRARIPDATFAPLFDALSRTPIDGRKAFINYRDLSVRELGAVYEKLLEYEPVIEPSAQGGIDIRLNAFARKGSGSYYTPDELVKLIIERTVAPLIEECRAAFATEVAKKKPDARALETLDPANAILNLKICDPAMGSGHFLVALVDYLADEVYKDVGQQPEVNGIAWESPVLNEAGRIRDRIKALALQHGWRIRDDMVDDKAIIRRMVLKRCVFGVDKNPMAVELAKVALWLHTLTAGAPLSFLDHHLKCGDSLFGEWVRPVMDGLASRGGLLINSQIQRAEGAASGMAIIERLTDADMAEAEQSRSEYIDVEARTEPIRRFMDFWHALKWLNLSKEQHQARDALLDGAFGDVIMVASGVQVPPAPSQLAQDLYTGGAANNAALLADETAKVRDYVLVRDLIDKAHALAAEERFLHWQIAFPRVWTRWTDSGRHGGFDAIIGNPPWDRMKMQEVEWFAARAPEIARQPRAADRKKAILALETAGAPLAKDYARARERAETGVRLATKDGDYPLLGRGDVNLYSLFVERAQTLIKPSGIAGLLVPSGIASDMTASHFFRSVSTTGRIRALFDFENRGKFFPDVHRSFKFCAFIVSGAERRGQKALCGFFLTDPPPSVVAEDDDHLFLMDAADFLTVNPNTATAPIFRTRRDAELTKAIYARLPVLVDKSKPSAVVKAWPVEYSTMFHMAVHAKLFISKSALESRGAYQVTSNEWKLGEDQFLPLYEGKMVQAYDHRAASIEVDSERVYRPGQPLRTESADYENPKWSPTPQSWVDASVVPERFRKPWFLGFKDITSSTNMRTMIAAAIPYSGVGDMLPLVLPASDASSSALALILGNMNSTSYDYVARQKVQANHLKWYTVEQLPVIPPAAYTRAFGSTTAEAIVKHHVLRLSYTAWDLEGFARDMGHVGADGKALPPFIWNEAERRQLRARLDALYFILYGILDEADVRYILSTFPIVEKKDRAAHNGTYLTAELIIWYMRALNAGDAETDAPVDVLLRRKG
jgi:hypothetical protein